MARSQGKDIENVADQGYFFIIIQSSKFFCVKLSFRMVLGYSNFRLGHLEAAACNIQRMLYQDLLQYNVIVKSCNLALKVQKGINIIEIFIFIVSANF